MRYLALLVVVGCGGGDERAAVLPSDGTGGADGGAVAAGGRESAGGAQTGTGGRECAEVVGDDCLRGCEADDDCPSGEVCVATMQTVTGWCDPSPDAGPVACNAKVCRPTCTTSDDCGGELCHGFDGLECLTTCDRATRYACANAIICSWTTAGHCER